MIPVYKIRVPEYHINKKPDSKSIGAKIDKSIIKYFIDKKVAIRCIGSQDHPGKSVNDLIKIIKTIGTDRYDKYRKGDRYENIDNKHIDIFALDFKITKNGSYMEYFIEPFYSWPQKFNKNPIKLDIVIIYDRKKLKRVVHKYEGRDDIKKDGFVFKENKKKDTLMGIIKII